MWGIASLFMHFNGWRTLVGHITTLFMVVMGGKFIWVEYLMRSWMVTVQRIMKFSITSSAFGMGVFACPINTDPSAKTVEYSQNRYEERKAM